MPKFNCLKGYWNPIEVNSRQVARMIFRCDECAVCTQTCLDENFGTPKDEVNSESIAKAAAALRELLNLKPGSIQKKRVPCADRFAKRGLKTLVVSLFSEIQSVRNMGHGFPAIARVISENGPHIDPSTLRTYFNLNLEGNK